MLRVWRYGLVLDPEQMQATKIIPGNSHPVGEGAHTVRASQWNVAIGIPVPRSHSFMVLSSDAETARFPSAVTSTPWTGPEWPFSVRNTRPVRSSLTLSPETRKPLVSRLLSAPRHEQYRRGLSACAGRGRSPDCTPS